MKPTEKPLDQNSKKYQRDLDTYSRIEILSR